MGRKSLSTAKRSLGRKSSGGGMININLDSATIRFDDLFETLGRYKSESGNLSIPVSHPTCLSILDTLSSFGMEELLTQRWNNQFHELKAFKSKSKGCLVPSDHPTLGNWAKVQHANYKLYDQKIHSPLTKKRFDKLKSVGFGEDVAREKEDEQESAGAAMGGSPRSLDSFENRPRKKIESESTNASAALPKPLSRPQKLSKSLPSTYQKSASEFVQQNAGVAVAGSARSLSLDLFEDRPRGKSESESTKGSTIPSEKFSRRQILKEEYEKRMIQRSIRKGLGHISTRSFTEEEVVEKMKGNRFSDGVRYSGLMRSCASANASSNEKSNSSDEPTLSNQQSYRLNDRNSASSPAHTDDMVYMNYTSWSELDDAIAVALGKSASSPAHKDDINVNYTSWSELDDAIAVGITQSVLTVQSDVLTSSIKALQ